MAGFAGVRRSELVREYAEDQVLRWEDVDWQKQLITVRPILTNGRIGPELFRVAPKVYPAASNSRLDAEIITGHRATAPPDE
jgi:hypothetical protein